MSLKSTEIIKFKSLLDNLIICSERSPQHENIEQHEKECEGVEYARQPEEIKPQNSLLLNSRERSTRDRKRNRNFVDLKLYVIIYMYMSRVNNKILKVKTLRKQARRKYNSAEWKKIKMWREK